MDLSAEPVIYRIDAIYRWTLCGGAALICVVPLLGAMDSVQGYQFGPAVIALAVVAPIAGALVWLSWQPRLELSDQGLCVARYGSSILVPWDQVERLAVEPDLQGVVLKQPCENPAMQRQRWAAMRSGYDAANYSAQELQLISELRFINLSVYRRQLGEVAFARIAERYRVPVTGTHHGEGVVPIA